MIVALPGLLPFFGANLLPKLPYAFQKLALMIDVLMYKQDFMGFKY